MSEQKFRETGHFNPLPSAYPKDQSVAQVFEAIVAAFPEKTALSYPDGSLTFDLLNERANQLAHNLLEQGIAPGEMVGITAARSPEMIIAMLAVLKAGGAYVPLEMAWPQERVLYILESCAATKLLVHGTELDYLPPTIWQTDLLDEFSYDVYDTYNPELEITALAPAYVLFTSGSTGQPKGVVVPQRAINRLVINTNFVPITADDVFLQTGSLTFDASTFDIWGPLLNGATIHIPERDTLLDGTLLGQCIREQGITTMWLTAGLFNQLADMHPDAFTGLRHLLVGGDRLSVAHITKIQRLHPDLSLINGYGPTENTTFSACYTIPRWEGGEIPIGTPIANSRIYVLNNDLLPVATGETGEICMAGDGLALGYLNDDALTASKFVPDPFYPGERMYRSGDLGHWDENGLLHFEGRTDRQVKIRGYRIELGEIENRLLQLESIRQAVVTDYKPDQQQAILCAYLVADRDLNFSEIRAQLSALLPDFMLPAHYAQLEKIPLTANGKVDRAALPLPDANPADEAEATDLNGKILKIWQRVLGVQHIQDTDNFFELGGHSLRAMQVAYQVKEELELNCSVTDLFQHPTLDQFTQFLTGAGKSEQIRIEVLPAQEHYALSHAQKRMWVLNQLGEDNRAFHIPMLFRMQGDAQVEIFRESVSRLIERHHSLRTVFRMQDGEPRQFVLQTAHLPEWFSIIPNNTPCSPESEQKIRVELGQQHFDLSSGPLIRVNWYSFTDQVNIIAVNLHHIISDGWSMQVIAREIQHIYSALIQEQEIKLPELSIQYTDFAAWQNQQLEGESASAQLNWWKVQLQPEGAPIPVLNLPTDYPRPATQSFNGRSLSFGIPKTLSQQLKQYAQQKELSHFMLMLANTGMLLSKYAGQTELIIGSPIAGREHAQLENQIGVFINLLAYRITCHPNESVRDLLQRTKQQTLEAYDHQAYPFDLLVNELDLERDLSRSPLFDVCLMFQNFDLAGNASETRDELQLEALDAPVEATKYDLTFIFSDDGDQFGFNIEYNPDLFEEWRIRQMSAHFLQLMARWLAAPETSIGKLDLLTADERQRIINSFNQTALSLPSDASIISELENYAARHPDQLALKGEPDSYTYVQLIARSHGIAQHLLAHGLQSGELIGVHLERGNDLVLILLGILRAGGAYLPLDPQFPQDRVAYLIADSGIKKVISQQSDLEAKHPDIRQLNPQDLLQQEIEQPQHLPHIAPEQLAYVIYTSGSTGMPKGVLIEHRQVVNFFYGMDQRIPFEAGSSSLLQITSISFDISVLEIFWTLTRGITLCVPQQIDLKAARKPEQPLREMDFGLFYFSSGEKTTDKYHLLLEGAKFADQHGFHSVWTPERHFHEFGGIYPNPSITAAALATITKNLRIRSGSVVLPLHNPIRVAEEWSVVDNLSNGRVDLSFASGWVKNDFNAFAPDLHETRQAELFKRIETVRQLWRGDAIDLTGNGSEHETVRIYPRPIQPELPVWITAGGSPDTFRSAGASGANMLTHLLGQTVAELKERIAIYREARAAAGHPGAGTVSLMLHVCVGENLQEILDLCRKPFGQYLRSATGLFRNFMITMGRNPDEETFSEADLEALINHAIERYYNTAALIGTIDSCMPLMQQLSDAGVDEIACLTDFGVDEDRVLAQLPFLSQLKDHYQQLSKRKNQQRSTSDYLRDWKITHLQGTPSLMKLLLAEDANAIKQLDVLMLGGEALPSDLVQEIKRHSEAQIHNMYGPTETTIWSSTQHINSGDVLIGKPIANTRIYVLNEQLQALPAGIPGELYIAGSGLARGYHQRPELTAERFIPNPFAEGNMYRTGDLACWLPDGTLRHLGRNDDQVKIRGHRIEPGEIEAVLLTLEGIRDCAIVAEGESEKHLVAYLLGPINWREDQLRETLAEKLPDYFMPASFVVLDSFPLTPNGKTDRRKLSQTDGVQLTASQAFEAPQSEAERVLAGVWQQLLRSKSQQAIGVQENFFRIGGDSIKAIQVAAMLAQQGYKLEVREIFAHPVIRELAPLMRRLQRDNRSSRTEGKFALTPVQNWFFEHYPYGETHYNHAVLLRLDHDTDLTHIQQALQFIYRHHDGLRSIFGKDANGNWEAQIQAYTEPEIIQLDLRGQANEKLEEQIALAQRSFELDKGPLFKAALYQVEDGYRLLLVVHHLLIDGISWRILFNDLQTVYTQLQNGENAGLPSKSDSLIAWSELVQHYAIQAEREAAITYWNQELQRLTPAFPIDEPAGSNTIADLHFESIVLNEQDTALLLTQANEAYHTQINDLLLAALAKAFGTWKPELSALWLLLEGHGREELDPDMDFSRTVGWFTSLIPLRLETQSQSWAQAIPHTKTHLRRMPNKGVDYGLLRYTGKLSAPEPELPVLFNYLGQIDEQQGDEKLFVFAPEGTGNGFAPASKRPYLLEITGMSLNGQLKLNIGYSKQQFEAKNIQALNEAFREALESIIEHTVAQSSPQFSIHDFAPANLYHPAIFQDWPRALNQSISSTENIQSIYPLSPLQEGMLYHYLSHPNSTANVHQLSYEVNGKLDPERFKQSWDHLLMRHDMLRTRFLYEQLDYPIQVVLRSAETDFRVFDWRNESENKLQQFLKEDTQRGFQPDRDALLRITLIQHSEASFTVIWSYHHLILDGWCMGIIMQEVLENYQLLIAGKALPEGKAPGYGRFITYLNSLPHQASEKYWKSYLEDYEPNRYFVGRETETYQPDSWQFTVDEGLKNQLETLARAEGVTLNSVLQAAWGMVVGKYHYSKDVVFGQVVSGRNPAIEQVDEIIGIFINTIPVRVRTSEIETLSELLHLLHDQSTQQQNHQHDSLMDIRRWIKTEAPLVDHLLVFDNFPVAERIQEGSSDDNPIGRVQTFEHTDYNLAVTFYPGQRLGVHFEYNAAVFSAEWIQLLSDHVLYMLEQMAQQPDRALSTFSLLRPDAQQRALSRAFSNQTPVTGTYTALLAEAFSVHQYRTAIHTPENAFSYEELQQKCTGVQQFLMQQQLAPGSVVGVWGHPQADLIAVALGIWFSGHTYLPLDDSLPAERLNYILNDSSCALLINLSGNNCDAGSVRVWDGPISSSAVLLVNHALPEHTAYIIYTSGTTGLPKGVAVSHRSMLDYLQQFNRLAAITPADCVIQQASIGFDTSLEEFLPVLLQGGSVYPVHHRKDLDQLAASIATGVPTVLSTSPLVLSYLNQSLSDYGHMRLLISGGEALKSAHIARFPASLEIINTYGPTEATVVITAQHVADRDLISLGKPLANRHTLILDPDRQLLPDGIPGQLAVSGLCLAQGYLGDDQATASKFIFPDFAPEQRFYLTGDQVMADPNGDLQFLGRIDQQVKIRGYRVETAEIEQHLLALDGITHAHVRAFPDKNGNYALCAYWNGSGDEKALHESLTQQLPEYMLPVWYLNIEHWPLTPSGKLDNRALPHPDLTPVRFEAPVSPNEKTLALLWAEVLQTEHIGRDSHFFKSGGHSITAMLLISRIHKQFDVRLPIQSVFAHPLLHQQALLIDTADKAAFSSIPPAAEAGHYPLSASQRRMYMLWMLNPQSTAYNMPGFYEVTGMDQQRFKAAIQQLIQRHAVLRTRFELRDGEPVQLVDRDSVFEPEIRQIASFDADACMTTFVRPFDLSSETFRMELLTVNDGRQFLFMDVHHIVSDAITAGILLRDFLKAYSGTELPVSEIQYVDYAVWQHRQLTQEQSNKQRQYWLDQFSGEIPVLELPYKSLRPASNDFAGALVHGKLSKESTQFIKNLGDQQESTLFMTLLAGFSALLQRYSGQDDIVIGTPVTGRTHLQTMDMAGVFINSIALRTKPNTALTFRELLTQCRNTTIEGFAHQDYPFDQLVSELQLDRDMSRNPLFDVLLVWQTAETQEMPESDLQLKALTRQHHQAKFDLTLTASEDGDQLSFGITYRTALFDAWQAEAMASHLMRILEWVCQHPDTAIGEMDLLDETEKKHLLALNPAPSVPVEGHTMARFEAICATYPDHAALAFGAEKLSYRALQHEVTLLAQWLGKQYPIAPDSRIAICLPTGFELPIAMLAILQAGAAYVPIDPAYPAPRREYMLQDSGALCCIDEAMFARFTAEKELLTDAFESISFNGREHELAYVIYTSGSTGQPKGVMTEHRQLMHYNQWFLDEYHIESGNNDSLLLSNIAFDGVNTAVFGTLLSGGCLHLASPELLRKPVDLAQCIRDQHITFIKITPPLLHTMIQDEDAFASLIAAQSLQLVVCGGEKMHEADVQLLLEMRPDLKIINHYGPTETTVGVLTHPVKAGAYPIPIGKPIHRTRVYVVNDTLQLQAPGVPGELLIAGDGVTRGYLNRPDLTAERFVQDPFGEGRAYRSGDLVQWTPEGEIRFIGRRDAQIKIRGYRIETGEVEGIFKQLAGVHDALLLPFTLHGETRLCAYAVCDELLTGSVLRERMAEQVPAYMVPDRVIVLEAFPVTPNGKIDRAALPRPEALTDSADWQAPQNPAEEILAQVWQTVLHLDQVSVTSNFFESGGDSIKAIQMMSRLRQRGYTFELRDLFEHPTIRLLAPWLKKQVRTASQELFIGDVQPTPVQAQFLQTAKNPNHFNMAVSLETARELSETALKQALKALVVQHDALRIRRKGDRLHIGTPSDADVQVQVYHSDKDFEEHELETAVNTIQHSISITEGPLLVAGIFNSPAASHVLWVVHHLAIDGISWRILLDDLQLAYTAALRGDAISFPLKTDSFAAWTNYLHLWARSDAFEHENNWWQEVESHLPIVDNASSAATQTQQLGFSLDEASTQRLLTEAHAAFHTETADLLLTALAQSLGENSLALTLEGHGRESDGSALDISRTLGWFTTHYPVYVALPALTDMADSLMRVKAALRAVPNKGLGYGLWQQHHRDGSLPQRVPKFKFNYLGQIGQENDDQEGIFKLSDQPTGRSIATENERADQTLITAIVVNGKLRFSIEFDAAVHAPETMKVLIEKLETQLRKLIDWCSASKNRQLTPGDFLHPALDVDVYNMLRDQIPASYQINNIYPLTPMQEGLLFQSLMEPHSGLYREQTRFRLQGEVHQTAFRDAFDWVLNRFELLRTRFFHAGLDRPVQVVLDRVAGNVSYLDLSGLDPAEQEQQVNQLALAIKQQEQIFGMQELMEISVCDLGHHQYEVCWTHHHILMDGWCNALVIGDFMQAYQAFCVGQQPVLPDTPPFSNYMRWLLKQNQHQARQYWADLLADYDHELLLPLQKTRPTGERKAATLVHQLSSEQTRRFNDFAGAHQVTQHQVLELAFGLLLQQYNRSQDIVFGTIVSGRQAPVDGIENMMGLFINTQPVRLQVHASDEVRDLLLRLRQQATASLAYDYFPLAEIQALTTLQHKLIKTLLVFENYPVAERIARESEQSVLQLKDVRISSNTNYDLTLVVNPGNALHLEWLYQEDVYESESIQRLAQQFSMILDQLMDGLNPSQIQLTTQEERSFLLDRFNDTTSDYQAERSLSNLFEEMVTRYPDHPALAFDDRVLTYQQMNEQVNQLAHALLDRGIRKGDRVALLFERSFDMYLAIFAVLKSGAAYVPLDPDYPEERLQFLLEDAEAKMLLSHREALTFKPVIDTLLFHEADWSVLPTSNPQVEINGEDAAYVIYTSGSTGTPKGTLLKHKSVNRLVRNTNYIEFVPEDVVLQLSSYAFDGSVFDVFGALLNGACLRIIRHDEILDVSLLRKAFVQYKTTVTVITSTLFNLMIDEDAQVFSGMRKLVVGGEKLSVHHIRKAFEVLDPGKLINGYGPTECCVMALCKLIHEADASLTNVPIGKPISNTSAFILDQELKLVPPGMPGELYLGGDGLAWGYLNRQDLTEKAFIPHPFAGGERLYKTGDLVQMLPDGDVVFLSRIDEQVKIRGFRIEPGEIEQHVLRAGAREALVSTPEDGSGSKRLVAYVVTDHNTIEMIRKLLRENLPSYLIPEQLIEVDEIPRNRNGKADLSQLPAPEWQTQRVSMDLNGDIQHQLADLWEGVLGVKPGANDSFFALGGHSLKLMTLLNRIHRQFGIKPSIAALFSHDTIAAQEKLLMEHELTSFKPITRSADAASYPLAFGQKRMCQIQQSNPDMTAYNIPIGLRFTGLLEPQRVKAALEVLMLRHEVLRTRISQQHGEMVQIIEAHLALPFELIENQPGDDVTLLRDFVRPFDLQTAPLWRCRMIRRNEQEHLLLFDIHHVISDGYSINRLITEFSSLLNGEQLPEQEYQYRDYVLWEATCVLDGSFEKSRSYWLHELAGDLPQINLPYDFERPAVKNFEGAQIMTQLDQLLVSRIRQFNTENKCTLYQSMLAVWYLLLWQEGGQTDLVTGTPVAGRTHAALEQIQGMFANNLALRIQIDADKSFPEFLQQVKQRSLNGFNHQQYPFSLLIQDLEFNTAPGHFPVFDVYFTVQNAIDQTPTVKNLEISSIPLPFNVSKLDLSLRVHEGENSLVLEWIYSKALFRDENVQRMTRLFESLWQLIIEDPTLELKNIRQQITL